MQKMWGNVNNITTKGTTANEKEQPEKHDQLDQRYLYIRFFQLEREADSRPIILGEQYVNLKTECCFDGDTGPRLHVQKSHIFTLWRKILEVAGEKRGTERR